MSTVIPYDPASGHGADAASGVGTLARARTFHTLDALRGVAALAVVLFHAAFIYGIRSPAEGQIAVDLFFVMSGFIIAFRYDADLRAGMTVGAFVRVRLVRLYPLYVLGAILGALPEFAAVAAGDADWFHRGLAESFPFHVFMIPTRFVVPRIEELYPLNYVAWSLVLEILINLAYAATFRLWTVRRLAMLVGAAFVGLCACAAHYGTLNIGFAWPHAAGGVVRILYGFPMGVLIYRLYARKPFAIRVPWWVLLAIAGFVFFFDAPWAKPGWELIAVSIVVPLIVVAAVVNEPPRAAYRACALAGGLSYAIYSLHAAFVGLFLRGETRLHLDLQTTSVARALAFTSLLALVCVASDLAYDRPVRQWLSRRRPTPRRHELGSEVAVAKN